MRTKREIEITVETERILVISRRRNLGLIWCAVCATLASVVTAEEAGIIAHVNSGTIYHWVDDGRLHFMETPEGWGRICLTSLMQTKLKGEAL